MLKDVTDSSLVQAARSNLADYGLEVSKPLQVVSTTDLGISEMIDSGRATTAANYEPFNDRLEIRMPSAKVNAVLDTFGTDQVNSWVSEFDDIIAELSEEQLIRFNSSREHRRHTMDLVSSLGSNISGKGAYYAAVQDIFDIATEVESISEEYSALVDKSDEIVRNARKEILFSTEHELIHKADADDFAGPEDYDERIRRLHDGFSSLEELENLARGEFFDQVDFMKYRNLGNDQEMTREAAYAALNSDKIDELKKVVKNSLDALNSRKDEIIGRKASTSVDSELLERIDDLGSDALDKYFNATVMAEEVSKESLQRALSDYSPENELIDRIYNKFIEEKKRDQKLDEELEEIKDKKQEVVEEAVSTVEENVEDSIGEIDRFLEPLYDRKIAIGKGPEGVVSEAFAQFWSAYRSGQLDDMSDYRERMENAAEFYPQGEIISKIMSDLYDEFENYSSSEDAVQHVFSLRKEYFGAVQF